MASSPLVLQALDGIPEVVPGQSLADIICAAADRNRLELADHDVLVLCQKIVSKAEGRYVDLRTVTPSARAIELAACCNKEPAFVELVLRESTDVVRCVPDVLIVRHRLGFVVANAGIDRSNIPDAEHQVLLLPDDPDGSATLIREGIRWRLGIEVGVLINDSFGRPWRQGVCGTGIGCAGLVPLLDLRGTADRFDRALRVTQVAVADELAAAASLLMGQSDEGIPVILVRGLARRFLGDGERSTSLIRPPARDLFL
jgi:coenzyme F420-0:L-glutamate ligase/coenzyme F420-1:gamma-L-glutamate ligase